MKVALITGGSRGIGAATVEKFAKEHYTVILNFHNSHTLAEDLRHRLLREGCDVHCYAADLTDFEQVTAMFDFVAHFFKKIDVLVNNAGISLNKQLQDVTVEDYDSVMNVNAKAAFFCCQQALPLLKKSDGGSIVNVSSIWGLDGASCESAYSMSKFAVVGLTKSLAKELQPLGIRVNCVCPPIVNTKMSANLTDLDKAEFCKEHNVHVYEPCEVASDIYALAVGTETGKILIER